MCSAESCVVQNPVENKPTRVYTVKFRNIAPGVYLSRVQKPGANMGTGVISGPGVIWDYKIRISNVPSHSCLQDYRYVHFLSATFRNRQDQTTG